jgi:calcium/calmodulin-dependent protein kinase I
VYDGCRGSFATVKKATCRSDETDWAVKIIDKTKLDKEDEEALKVEVEILQRVDHPNIVSLRQVYDCPKVFYMVMELMTGGELFDRIVEKEKYTEAEARAVVYKLAQAIKYCHDLGIVHRDLKVRVSL